ncbi:class-III pyridoxal-phosphate-dependent aminotransferase [Rhodococcus tibetensis]|uniref:Aspartate aminotransferase family protein n=1 Tax=Rhodococcus tibetensis TaxID=2965064 RepID=A0ABT1Q9K1_9NOCA|nr:aspartate aminotransferase family protein [Rhodococcus sp. FXJ9.536]MCQ4118934.1 aspartate aminotransferase family protein [Rhodococcus sp. FXJ9.536]
MTADRQFAGEPTDTLDVLERYLSPPRAAFYRALGDVPTPSGSDGVFIYHSDGRDLLDCRSAGGVFNLGHRNPRIRELVTDSLNSVDIGDWLLPSVDRGTAARAIAKVLPDPLELVTFGTSGGEAVDMACDLARRHTGRERIVGTDNAYHGQIGTAELLSQTGATSTRTVSPQIGVVPFGDIDAALNAVNDDVAAFVLEPIQAAAGLIIPAYEYLQAVRRRCNETGTVLVVDEVQTGLGRTGSMWAIDIFGVVPDVLVVGKGLSGGVYPISACIYTREIGRAISDTPFFRPSSFSGSELGCRVARSVVETVSDAKFLASVRECGGLLAHGLNELVKRRPTLFAASRGVGLMCALELANPDTRMSFVRNCWAKGLLVSPAPNHARAVLMMPPLIITTDQVDLLLTRLSEAAALTQG